MAQISEIHLAHTSPTTTVYAALFTGVRNSAFLRQQLIAGNTDFEYAFIDANMILSTTHVLASVFRSIQDMSHNRLKSRNVHSEIVFNLSPTNNIADSFRRFGVTDSTTDLLAIKIGIAGSDHITHVSVTEHLTASIEGNAVPFADDGIARVTDLNAISKVYKLGAATSPNKVQKKGAAINGTADDAIKTQTSMAETQRKDLETYILAMMALKGS